MNKDSDGSSTYYVYGNSLISQERIDAEGSREYRVFHYDFRGSTVAMTDQYGNVTDRITYDPYGEITSRSGNTDTIFLYNGKYGVQTDDNGLIYMRARYYSTDLKRFISEDPMKDRINWYTYGYSNPLNYIDPEGTIAPAVLVVVGIVEVGLWIYSGYSLVQAVRNRDWVGAAISAVGFFIPPAAVVRGASAAWRGASAAWRGASAAWKGAGAGSRVVSNIARAMNGVMRGAGAAGKTAAVATTASNTVRSGSTVMKMAGSGGRVGSGLSGVGGIARLAGGASAAGSGVRYLLTGPGSPAGPGGIDFYATPGGTVVPTATIPFKEYTSLYDRGVHNMSSKTVMLGKYDGRGPTSYIIKAGTTHAYFDMGGEYDIVKATYRLEDADMFKLFNVPFLDEGIRAGKTFHFSHDPRGDRGALGEELQYLRANGYDFDPLAMIAYPK